MNTTNFTIWKRCNSCGTMNNKVAVKCRDCNNYFVNEDIDRGLAPCKAFVSEEDE